MKIKNNIYYIIANSFSLAFNLLILFAFLSKDTNINMYISFCIISMGTFACYLIPHIFPHHPNINYKKTMIANVFLQGFLFVIIILSFYFLNIYKVALIVNIVIGIVNLIIAIKNLKALSIKTL